MLVYADLVKIKFLAVLNYNVKVLWEFLILDFAGISLYIEIINFLNVID